MVGASDPAGERRQEATESRARGGVPGNQQERTWSREKKRRMKISFSSVWVSPLRIASLSLFTFLRFFFPPSSFQRFTMPAPLLQQQQRRCVLSRTATSAASSKAAVAAAAPIAPRSNARRSRSSVVVAAAAAASDASASPSRVIRGKCFVTKDVSTSCCVLSMRARGRAERKQKRTRRKAKGSQIESASFSAAEPAHQKLNLRLRKK